MVGHSGMLEPTIKGLKQWTKDLGVLFDAIVAK